LRVSWLRRLRPVRVDAAFFADCHRRLDALLQPAIAFWQGTVDWERGGFFGLVDHGGHPRPRADKDLIQQVRHLWTFSHLHRRESATPAIAEVCHHQYRFVRDRLYDARRAQFHRAVTCDGAPVTGDVHHYPLAFGVFALAGYAAAFPGTAAGSEALGMAKDVFDAMVERSWDPEHGFDETVYPGRWCAHAKEINTQMHLLEAAAELYEAVRLCGDPAASAVRAVLDRQLTLIVTRGIVERRGARFCSPGYGRDWSVVEERASDCGHDIEVVYLAVEAAKLLGRERESAVVEAAMRVGSSVTERGYDRARGKWFHSADPVTGRVLRREAVFWVQFEALNGLSTMWQLTSEPHYLDKFERVLTWLETKQYNPAVGEWYSMVDDRGRPLARTPFGEDCAWLSYPWKASYHSVRALVTRKRWIEEDHGACLAARPRSQYP
jgi:mannobiose 2-epimerase